MFQKTEQPLENIPTSLPAQPSFHTPQQTPKQNQFDLSHLDKKSLFIFAGVLIFLGVTVAFAQSSTSSNSLVSKILKVQDSSVSEPEPSINPTPSTVTAIGTITSNNPSTSSENSQPQLSPTPAFTSAPTTTPVPKVTSTPTPTVKPTMTPTSTPRIPNPPKIGLGYPNNHNITMNDSQTLCAVDVPEGGNTKGLQRRHKHNDESWTAYTPHYTLCWDPPNGENTLQVQYKNEDGDESSVITRKFTFTRTKEISYTLNGKIYEDKNCNAKKDSGESYVDNITAHVFKMPGNIALVLNDTDTDGTYSYKGKMQSDEKVSINIALFGTSGYKSHPKYDDPTVTFDKDNRTRSVETPVIPYEYVSSCNSVI